MKEKSVLIIGALGFIGQQLFDFLTSTGYSCLGLDTRKGEVGGNIYALNSLIDDLPIFFSNTKFDYCINAAGSGNVYKSYIEPYHDFLFNVKDTEIILEAIRQHQNTCKYIHISSAAVYGNPCKLPVNECDELHPISSYGWNKLISEKICLQYNQIYDVPVTIVRPFSIFGPGLRKQIIWDLYQKLEKSDQMELSGTGSETRDFIYISDFTTVIELLMRKSDFDSTVYNIGTGVQRQIKEIANFFTAAYPDKKISFNNIKRVGDPEYWLADISKIIELGFSPETNFSKGLTFTLNWLQNEQ